MPYTTVSPRILKKLFSVFIYRTSLPLSLLLSSASFPQQTLGMSPWGEQRLGSMKKVSRNIMCYLKSQLPSDD